MTEDSATPRPLHRADIPHLPATVAGLNTDRIAALRDLFPEAFTEGRVDFDKLRAALGDYIETGKERYTFTWAGKTDALRTLHAPASGTLVPAQAESINWAATENLFIEGDNLEVLKLLRQAYSGRVKLIYIDPPYNTGNDFIYPDNFIAPLQPWLEMTGQADANGTRLTSNPENRGRYHSTWLNMMYPRLVLARQLLTDEGVMLVSISDEELGSLLHLMNEVFGEENRLCVFVWKSRAKPTNAGSARFRPQRVAEYIVAYSKRTTEQQRFNVSTTRDRAYPHTDKDGRYRTTTILTSNRGVYRRETLRFEAGGYTPPDEYRWKAGKPIVDLLFESNRIHLNEDGLPLEKKYEHEEDDPLWPIYCFVDPELSGTAENGKAELNDILGNQHGVDTVKPVSLLRYLISTFSDPQDVVMDFFAGTSTTAQAVVEFHVETKEPRSFVCVQIPQPLEPDNKEERTSALFCDSIGKPRNVAEISKERIRRVITNLTAKQPKLAAEGAPQPDLGFRVFKLAPSHLKGWSGVADLSSDSYIAQLSAFADPFVTAAVDPDALIWEVAIKHGFPLTSRIESSAVAGHVVYRVTNPANRHAFHICLDDEVTPEVVARLALTATDLFVCRDSAVTDTAAANLALQCRLELL